MSPSYLACLVCLAIALPSSDSGAIQLNSDSFDATLAQYEIVFVNFYADWCRFSNMLEPVWEETATKLVEEMGEGGKVAMGKVDCDKEPELARRFHITKYPTLKLIKFGQPAKKEYRGQRSADAFLGFLREQTADPFQPTSALDNDTDTKKRHLVAYYGDKESEAFSVLRKVASYLSDLCAFHLSENARADQRLLLYRPPFTNGESDEAFAGNALDFEEMLKWTQERCIPIVREITFENAEELTEEGLPFVIFFYDPSDLEPIKRFNELIQRELLPEKEGVNFLTADGHKFSHPLQHLGKSKSDLPLIAIDSFRHMYLFPDYKRMDEPGAMKKFIADLHSGKLHREFHWGPDPETTPPVTEAPPSDDKTRVHVDVPDDAAEAKPPGKSTSPPESTFAKLAPSSNRYTLLRDEL